MTSIVPRTGLKEGEKILWVGRPRLVSMLGRLILSIILILIGLSLLNLISLIGAILILIGVAIIIRTVIEVTSYRYYVTNMRVIEEHWLFSVEIKETTLDKITDIVFYQGLLGRLLNYGTVHIHTAGTGFLGMVFRNVKEPLLVRGIIINAKDSYYRIK